MLFFKTIISTFFFVSVMRREIETLPRTPRRFRSAARVGAPRPNIANYLRGRSRQRVTQASCFEKVSVGSNSIEILILGQRFRHPPARAGIGPR